MTQAYRLDLIRRAHLRYLTREGRVDALMQRIDHEPHALDAVVPQQAALAWRVLAGRLDVTAQHVASVMEAVS